MRRIEWSGDARLPRNGRAEFRKRLRRQSLPPRRRGKSRTSQPRSSSLSGRTPVAPSHHLSTPAIPKPSRTLPPKPRPRSPDQQPHPTVPRPWRRLPRQVPPRPDQQPVVSIRIPLPDEDQQPWLPLIEGGQRLNPISRRTQPAHFVQTRMQQHRRATARSPTRRHEEVLRHPSPKLHTQHIPMTHPCQLRARRRRRPALPVLLRRIPAPNRDDRITNRAGKRIPNLRLRTLPHEPRHTTAKLHPAATAPKQAKTPMSPGSAKSPMPESIHSAIQARSPPNNPAHQPDAAFAQSGSSGYRQAHKAGHGYQATRRR